jgi:hypothetical protein
MIQFVALVRPLREIGMSFSAVAAVPVSSEQEPLSSITGMAAIKAADEIVSP